MIICNTKYIKDKNNDMKTIWIKLILKINSNIRQLYICKIVRIVITVFLWLKPVFISLWCKGLISGKYGEAPFFNLEKITYIISKSGIKRKMTPKAKFVFRWFEEEASMQRIASLKPKK